MRAYLKARAALIGEHAVDPAHGNPLQGGTVYLATADDDGNMVSFIQSNFKGFGSGMVVPGTGISLQNRGWSFSLDPEHANALAPGKRTYHTIIPGFDSDTTILDLANNPKVIDTGNVSDIISVTSRPIYL